jgi:hypothetical protein
MFASGNFSSFEAGPDLECLGGWDGKHGMAECSFELVKHWFTQARRNVANDTGHGSTDRVLGILCPDDSLCIDGE